MGNYVELQAALRYSTSPDFGAGASVAPIGFLEELADGDRKVLVSAGNAVPTTGLTWTIPSAFTTIDFVVIANTGTAAAANGYDFLARSRVVIASKTFATTKLTFADANPDTIADADSTFLSALYFRKGMYAVVSGTTDAGNTGTFLVQTAAAGTLTLAAAETLTARAGDVATPTIKSVQEVTQLLSYEASAPTILQGVQVASDIVLTGISGTGQADIIVVGT